MLRKNSLECGTLYKKTGLDSLKSQCPEKRKTRETDLG